MICYSLLLHLLILIYAKSMVKDTKFHAGETLSVLISPSVYMYAAFFATGKVYRKNVGMVNHMTNKQTLKNKITLQVHDPH